MIEDGWRATVDRLAAALARTSTGREAAQNTKPAFGRVS